MGMELGTSGVEEGVIGAGRVGTERGVAEGSSDCSSFI